MSPSKFMTNIHHFKTLKLSVSIQQKLSEILVGMVLTTLEIKLVKEYMYIVKSNINRRHIAEKYEKLVIL